MRELDEILERLDMESYLDYMGIEYRHRHGSSGPQLNVRTCPSCGGSKWKVYINRDTGLGNCFHGSCEMGTFNKWRFIRAVLGDPVNREVYQHIKSVAIELGWRPVRKATATNIEVDGVALPASIELPDANGNIPHYLAARGITPEVCSYFRLRYCHKGGYVFRTERGTGSQDYSGRIIIPVFDLNGELVTFQGRDTYGTAESKYLFPPGLPASGRFLYNGHNAWHAIEVVIGEGAFDVMAMKMAFDEDMSTRHLVPVGTFGMHLSHLMDDKGSQLGALVELRRSGLKRVTFMWDGEKQAVKNALRAAELVRRVGLKARVAILPPGKDPNEVPREVVRKAYWEALDPSSMSDLARLLKLST